VNSSSKRFPPAAGGQRPLIDCTHFRDPQQIVTAGTAVGFIGEKWSSRSLRKRSHLPEFKKTGDGVVKACD